VEGGAAHRTFGLRRFRIAADLGELGQGQLELVLAALAELLELGQIDRQIVRIEGKDAGHLEPRGLVDQRAFGQAEDDDVRVVGAQELALLRSGGDNVAVRRAGADEDAGQVGAFLAAVLDPQGHAIAQIGELTDLDRRTERPGAQLEPQPFVIVARERLDEADDGEIQRRECDREHERHAQHPAVAHPHRAQHVELGAGGEAAESEQDAEHQPDRNAQSQIFGQQIGKHPPHDADRSTFGRDEVEQLQHPVEHEEHRGDQKRRDQRNRDQARHIPVECGHAGRVCGLIFALVPANRL